MENLQYLTFYIGDEIFAIEVLKIKEIIPYDYITPIPLMHSFVEGVMNIRGNVVPIVCLNKRVDLNVDMSSKKQSIIIVSLMYEDEESDVGIVVSMVNKVFTKDEATLETSPTFGSKIRKDLIKNIAKVEEQFIPILDIDKILNLDDLSETLQDAV